MKTKRAGTVIETRNNEATEVSETRAGVTRTLLPGDTGRRVVLYVGSP
jgi:hypothetical protein